MRFSLSYTRGGGLQEAFSADEASLMLLRLHTLATPFLLLRHSTVLAVLEADIGFIAGAHPCRHAII